MNKICGIYKITSPSHKVYIGQSLDVQLRFRYYKRLACKKQTFLYHSLKKHGVDNHRFEIIHVCEPNQLNELEVYYIDLFTCFNTKFGLNLRTGGSNGKLSKETKLKLSKIATGRKHTEETKMAMRESHKSRQPISEETRLKHSLSAMGKNKGKKHSEETIQKMKASLTGRPISKITREKIRARMMGNTQMLGRHHSLETIAKMKESANLRKKKL